MNAMPQPTEFWRQRLFVPNYRIGEAARYADISSQTVARWHQTGQSNKRGTLSNKNKGQSLSYLQLIEVAVVAQFRRANVRLDKIRAAREYVSKQLNAEFPFAEYRFKTDGKDLWMDYAEIEAKMGDNKLLKASAGGQLAWTDIIGRLQEFEYERAGLAVRWHLAGRNSPLVIDPRIQFGAPSVEGIATWAFKGRWEAGELLDDIADDFGVANSDVLAALEFEGVNLQGRETRH
ncbi:DUF433 domain-containing protein [Sandaracinobacteroides saxicola]|uniref:DUF433 domain-containing protein n=1 Tax=Sandaracinobacteroides saxicola TaxID=2759707 RepID=A0A7G5IGS6_9SPHN|nr:DUF433 domain-containing protein [Sandaracinobacteroides saxicola]QMW22568.1 hypothetical protein H3309_14815 [Sandaracinobacteroides saxicola]